MFSMNDTVAKEILRDLLTMYVCFNTQKKVKNPFIQELYGYIMVFFYSVFLHELYQAKLLEENPTADKTKKLVAKFRERFLKKQALLGKPHLDAIREEMGLDFEYFVYDTILTVDKQNKKKLCLINLGVWDLAGLEKDKIELFNSVAEVPENLIKELFDSLEEKDIAENIIKAFDEVCELKAKEIVNKIHPIKYPYASAVFFKNPEPCNQDKYLVLYYYTYFSLLHMLNEFVPAIRLEVGSLRLDMAYSLMKLKAMLIEAFGQTIKNLDTPVAQEIKQKIEDSFGKSDVFKLNRRLRNNIHYKNVDILTGPELKQIDAFQSEYIEIILSVFHSKIKFKFGKWYHLIKWVADHTDSSKKRLLAD